jgi:uncharacterized protein (DUF1330 family)
MSAYWIGRVKVNDPDKYKKYAGSRWAFPNYGRAREIHSLCGDRKQAIACFNSDEYNKAAALRRGGAAGEAEIAFVEAVG